MIRCIITIIPIISFFSCTQSTRLNSKDDKQDSIVMFLEEQLQKDLTSDSIEGSMSAAIVKDNKIIWSRAFGYSDRESKALADTSTIYRTGSITKSFTAFLMMQLVEEGVIKLNDPVEMYLPEVKKLNGYSPATKITFLELATHKSGLIREPELENAASGSIANWEAKIIASIPHTSFESKPGEKFSYSNIGYGMLGLALSRAANKPFMQLIQEKIFIPLQMTHSYFEVPAELTTKLAKGMSGGPGELDFETPGQEHAGRGYKVPNGGIYSTPNDLARFAIANLGYQKLLSADDLQSMQTGKLSGTEDYGIGLFINKVETGKVLSHGGSVAGYTACLAFEPASGYAMVIMRNYNFGKTDLHDQCHSILNELSK